MDEFTLIEKYLKKLTYNNPSALNLNDDVFFDKKNNVVISTDTYLEGVHFLNFRKHNHQENKHTYATTSTVSGAAGKHDMQ